MRRSPARRTVSSPGRAPRTAGSTPASTPASERRRQTEREHPPVEADGLQPREILGRDHRQQTDERPREEETEQAARDREHQALDDELLREPAQRRAERGAHGHLALTRVSAREQQVRDVRAGHEEHQRHAGHQQKERGTDVLGHLIDEGADADLDGTTLAEYPIDVRRDT